MSLDSIYAMQALPAPNKFTRKKGVQQVSDSAEVAAEHENEQTVSSRQPIERRKREDRRKEQQAFARERRQANRRQEESSENAELDDELGHNIDVTV